MAKFKANGYCPDIKYSNKVNAILEGWVFYAREKVEQGWILSKSKYPNLQFIENPNKDQEGEIKRIYYEDFAKTIKYLFYTASIHLINGEPLSLQGIGELKARRIERNLNKLILTGACKQRLKKGEVLSDREREYNTQPEWVRIHYAMPPEARFSNVLEGRKFKPYIRMYKFVIARNNEGDGFKDRFHNSNKESHTLKNSYDYKPSTQFIY